MKILAFTRYGHLAASSRVRTLQYIPYLEEQGIEVTVAPLFSNEYISNLYKKRSKPLTYLLPAYVKRLLSLLNVKRFDLLWIEKELFPMLPAWGEELISLLKIPYIVDYDDAIFHNYDLSKNVFVRSLLKDKIDIVMRKAAVVIAGNDYLAERALKAGAKRVEYLPSVVDLEKYKFSDEFNSDVFRIGWIGSPSTSKYLKLIYNVLIRFCSEHNTHLVLVGSGKINLPGIITEIREWSEEKEIADIQSFDVGIMPLPDEPWERGKCGYKLIQYMACGRPVIASPVGINDKLIVNGINGFKATTEEEWLNYLEELYKDYNLRKRMGQAGRKIVEEKYSVQVTTKQLVRIIKSI
ncbi:glycosyltransferase family 4 protein [Caldisericum sp.]|uniref:glycosyltransferase family 4 protein n=1 Tax=Caldisericum sp. TaxID=2499687 RepID=UPI003D0F18D2